MTAKTKPSSTQPSKVVSTEQKGFTVPPVPTQAKPAGTIPQTRPTSGLFTGGQLVPAPPQAAKPASTAGTGNPPASSPSGGSGTTNTNK